MESIPGVSSSNTVQHVQPQPARNPQPAQAQNQTQAQSVPPPQPAPTVNTSGQTTGTIVNIRA